MERNLTTDAIVLASRRWGDLHRRITLLSPALGVFDATAYGARKGKLAGGIEPFSNGLFYLYHNRTRKEYSIVDVFPIPGKGGLRNDLKRVYSASVMAELAMRMHGGDYAALYANLGACLALIDAGDGDPDPTLIQFIWRLIGIMGLEPDLVSCPVCGTPYGDAEVLSFNTAMHTPCCRACADVDADGSEMALGPGGRRYLVYTRSLAADEAVRVVLHDAALHRMHGYMVRYITNILGGSLRSLSGGMIGEGLV